MSLVVQKYGGTSVGDTDRIRNALRVETDAQVTRKPNLRLVGGDPHAA